MKVGSVIRGVVPWMALAIKFHTPPLFTVQRGASKRDTWRNILGIGKMARWGNWVVLFWEIDETKCPDREILNNTDHGQAIWIITPNSSEMYWPDTHLSYIHTLVLRPAFLLNCRELPSLSRGAAAYRSPSKNNTRTPHNASRDLIMQYISVRMHWLSSLALWLHVVM